MNDAIAIVEKILQFRNLIFNKRFIWLSVFIVLAVAAYYLKQNTLVIIFVITSLVLLINSIALYPWEKIYLKKIDEAIDNHSYDVVKELIEDKTLLISYPSKIEYDFLRIRYSLIHNHNPKDLFKYIESLENRYLLTMNNEKIKFILFKLDTYKKFENIKLIEETLNKLDEKSLRGLNLLSYKLGQSFLCEYNGDIKNAKDVLISLLEKQGINKVSLYNEIARLEELQRNYKQAIHYYEKSYEHLEQKPKANYFCRVLHNLVFVNVRVDNFKKAQEWLRTYELMIDKNNLFQYLDFLNTQLLLARQTEDRILLLDAYSKESIFVVRKLDEKRWIAHFFSRVKMSFNDGVNFEENLLSAKNLFPHIKILEFPKNYFIAKEIFYILKTLAEDNQLKSMKEFYLELIEYLRSFESTMHEYRKELPDLALTEQFYWLSEENILMKLNIAQEPKKSNFESYFYDIEQIKQYVKTYNNQYLLVRADMMIIDEFIAYSKKLDKPFNTDFKATAIEALKEAETIISENKINFRYFQFFIPMGYYYLELFDDKNKAKEYLDLFIEKQINIKQYAKWQRSYYESILKALQWQYKTKT